MRGRIKPYRRHAIAVWLLCLAFSQTACPKSSELTKAAKASRELAGDIVLAEQGIALGYTSGKISLAKKDKYARILKDIAVNGQNFNNALIALNEKYPEGTEPPAESLTFIRENWATVSAAFAALLAELNLFGLGDAVGALANDVNTISKVVEK